MMIECSVPPITITRPDRDRLNAIAALELAQSRDRGKTAGPSGTGLLARELTRAQLVEPDEVDADLVTMESFVCVRESATGRVRHVGLMYPDEADPQFEELSVLTPFGAALLGLSQGQSIAWRIGHADWQELTVLQVLYQPETARRRKARWW